jgi:hypothetical protein
MHLYEIHAHCSTHHALALFHVSNESVEIRTAVGGFMHGKMRMPEISMVGVQRAVREEFWGNDGLLEFARMTRDAFLMLRDKDGHGFTGTAWHGRAMEADELGEIQARLTRGEQPAQLLPYTASCSTRNGIATRFALSAAAKRGVPVVFQIEVLRGVRLGEFGGESESEVVLPMPSLIQLIGLEDVGEADEPFYVISAEEVFRL